MNDLTATTERLRHVKEATRHFLTLWALERARDRAREGRELIDGSDDVDTAAIEDAIRELDVYNSPSLISGVLGEN